MRDFLEYVAIIGLFFLFLVWIAVMRTPAKYPSDAFPQYSLTSQEYN